MDRTAPPVEHKSDRTWRIVVVLSAIPLVTWPVLMLEMVGPHADLIAMCIAVVIAPSVALLIGLHNSRAWADWLSIAFDASVAPIMGGLTYQVALWGPLDVIAIWLVVPAVAAVLRGSISVSKRIGWPAVIPYVGLAAFVAYRGFLLARQLPS